MNIRIEVKTASYRFLWLKEVTSFNYNLHCARCLKGNYFDFIPFGQKHKSQIYQSEIISNEYLYLCGVCSKYEENMHIAFIQEVGSEISFENKHVIVSISDAKQLFFERPQIDKPEIFLSCRNFQFGYQYLHGDNKHRHFKGIHSS